MSCIFFNDGYTLTKTVAAVPGLHGAASIVYRPALDQNRYAWRAKLDTKDPKTIADHLTGLVNRMLPTPTP